MDNFPLTFNQRTGNSKPRTTLTNCSKVDFHQEKRLQNVFFSFDKNLASNKLIMLKIFM